MYALLSRSGIDAVWPHITRAIMLQEVFSGKARYPSKKRRSSTTEFKAEVVELVRDDGQPVAQVARNLDLSETAVRGWLSKAQPTKESPISSDD